MTNTPEDDGSVSFDQSLQQLEELAARLENGEIPLEEALRVYERAVGLFRRCRETLGGVEQRIEKLTRDLEGEPLVTPLPADVDDDLDG